MLELTFVLSLLGFLASLTIHLLAAFGLADIPLQAAFGAFFPVLVVAVLANMRLIVQRRRDYVWLPPGEFWRFITRNAPGWMRSLQVGMVLYAFLNFHLTMIAVNRGAYPRIMEGAYVLERHKLVIETLTREQYLWHASFVVRMLSAIVMAVFFGAVMRWVARWRTAAEDAALRIEAPSQAHPLPEEAAR